MMDAQNRHTSTAVLSIPKERRKKYVKKVSYEMNVLKTCRLVVYAVLFAIVFGSGVYATLLLLSLIARYSQSIDTSKRDIALDIAVCSAFPSVIQFLCSAWKVMFYGRKRPTIKSIVKTMVVEIIASCGHYLLLFRVLDRLDSLSITICLMYLTFVPTVIRFIRSIYSIWKTKCKITCSAFAKMFDILPFVIHTACLVLYLIFILPNTPLTGSELQYMLPVSIIMKSLGFYENFFRKTNSDGRHTDVPEGTVTYMTQQRNDIYIQSHADDVRVKISDSKCNNWPNNSSHSLTEASLHIGLTKACIQLLAFGIIVLLLCLDSTSYMLIEIDHFVNSSNSQLTSHVSRETFNDTQTTVLEWAQSFYYKHDLAILLVLVSTAFSYSSSLACRLNMQRVAFALPINLIPVCVGVMVWYSCEYSHITEVIGISITCFAGQLKGYMYVLGSALWFGVMLVTWYIWVPMTNGLHDVDRLFVMPLMDGLYPVMNALLRRKNDLDKPSDLERKGQTVPTVKVCVTMWHETSKEMLQLLKSLFRLDNHVNGKENDKDIDNVMNKEKINLEMYLVFDNAFESVDNRTVPNEFVEQFIQCVDDAARFMLGENEGIRWIERFSNTEMTTMPYGGRLSWTLPGGTSMVVHLKDKRRIRTKKRSSQVMYMFYSLLFGQEELTEGKLRQKLQDTFVLTLDGDVDFEPESLWKLLYRMKVRQDIGVVCGRIHPIGSGPMVWYQQFEYATSHWLNKTAEQVFGCVMCCPGCFSLFRGSAVLSDNVLKTYTRLPSEARELFTREQGEDRWFTFLILQQGFKIEYCADAHANTYAPERLSDFYIQRKRWCPATLFHTLDFLRSGRSLRQDNKYINWCFLLYISIMFSLDFITPAVIFLYFSFQLMVTFNIGALLTFLILLVPIILFVLVCVFCSQTTQLNVATMLTGFIALLTVMITFGAVLGIVIDPVWTPVVAFIVFICCFYTIVALLHPREISCLIKGPVCFVIWLSTNIFFYIFYLYNLTDVKWGTRDKAKKTLIDQSTDNSKEEHREGTLNNGNRIDEDDRWLSMKTLNRFRVVDISYEDDFWKETIKVFLQPHETDPKTQSRLIKELLHLKNKWMYTLLFVNITVVFICLQIREHTYELFGNSKILNGIYPDIFILGCMCVVMLLFQFCGMLYYKWESFLHSVSRTALCSHTTFTCNRDLCSTRLNYSLDDIDSSTVSTRSLDKLYTCSSTVSTCSLNTSDRSNVSSIGLHKVDTCSTTLSDCSLDK